MVLDTGTRLLDGEEINRSTATGAPLIVAPNSGDTIALGYAQRVVYVNPAANIAALTIMLPPVMNAGAVVTVGFGKGVAALTVQDASGAPEASGAGTANAGMEFRYLGPPMNWVRWR